MKVKLRTIVTVSLLTTLLLVFAVVEGYFLFTRKVAENQSAYLLRCTALATFRHDEMTAHLSIDLRLDNKQRGIMVVYGEMEKQDGLRHVVSRHISFNYALSSGSAITLKDYAAQKYARDNTPDELFSHIIFDTTPGWNKLFIQNKGNVYLFSDSFSPLFTCVDKNTVNHL